jgi:hypothetical protein
MSTAFFLRQHIHLTLELRMGLDAAWLTDYLSTLKLFLFNTTKEATNVIAGLTFIKCLLEHFNTGNGGGHDFRIEANDFSHITDLDDASFDTTGCDSTATLDREDIFNGHKERLIVLSLWFFNVRIELFKKFRDASSLAFIFGILESRVRRTADDGSVITGEVVLRKKFTNFKFDKFKKLFVIDEVALVKEDNNLGYTTLTSEQNVLTRLRHGTI